MILSQSRVDCPRSQGLRISVWTLTQKRVMCLSPRDRWPQIHLKSRCLNYGDVFMSILDWRIISVLQTGPWSASFISPPSFRLPVLIQTYGSFDDVGFNVVEITPQLFINLANMFIFQVRRRTTSQLWAGCLSQCSQRIPFSLFCGPSALWGHVT